MRFLCVTHFFEGHGGGIERVAGHLNRHIAAAGHEMCWAASAADDAPRDPRVETLKLRCVDPLERLTGLPMPLPLPSACGAMRRAVGQADVVVIHDALYITSILARMFAARARKPVILIQHIAAIEFANPFMRGLMRLANRLVTRPMLCRADQVLFISDTVRAAFADVRMKCAARLLFNGVDGAVFHAGADDERLATRQRHGLPADRRLAVFVGRFVEKKGLRILREVARRSPQIDFAFAGAGPIDPGRWALANVHVLGVQPPTIVADLYRAADLLVLPSVGEGYPLVMQEAMACGLPIVCGAESARADPAASQWLRGVDIDLGDPEGSATRVIAAIEAAGPDGDQRRQMAAYAASAYRWPAMAAAIVETSREIVTER
ncbi:MAG: glycosyltransferase family 4 protein [Reyranellaceae bacterium]